MKYMEEIKLVLKIYLCFVCLALIAVYFWYTCYDSSQPISLPTNMQSDSYYKKFARRCGSATIIIEADGKAKCSYSTEEKNRMKKNTKQRKHKKVQEKI